MMNSTDEGIRMNDIDRMSTRRARLPTKKDFDACGGKKGGPVTPTLESAASTEAGFEERSAGRK